jgi:hypothetical protein
VTSPTLETTGLESDRALKVCVPGRQMLCFYKQIAIRKFGSITGLDLPDRLQVGYFGILHCCTALIVGPWRNILIESEG